MAFQEESGIITWKIHFKSSPEKVYTYLTTDKGRAAYWAESTHEESNIIHFSIYNYPTFTAKVLHKELNRIFSLDYFGVTTFTLTPDNNGGTDMVMVADVGSEEIKQEMTPGWVSVLLAMKAAVDHGVDIRNHDPQRSWQDGYADN